MSSSSGTASGSTPRFAHSGETLYVRWEENPPCMVVFPVEPWQPREALQDALTFLNDEQAERPNIFRAAIIARLNQALAAAERRPSPLSA